MKRKIVYLILINVIIIFGAVCVNAEERPSFDNGSVLIEMSDDIKLMSAEYNETDISDVFEEIGVSGVIRLDRDENSDISLFSACLQSGTYKLLLSEEGEENVLAAVDKLNQLPCVEIAQPNYCYYLDEAVNDTYYVTGGQYSLSKIGAEYVWDLNIDCSDIRVAVLDTGMNMIHEDLTGNLWVNNDEIPNNYIDDDNNGYIDDVYGWDFINDDNNPADGNGHGTHVCGIVSAVTNNGKGIASLARNAKIVPMKIFSDSGGTRSDVVVMALRYIKNKGFEVANCSWGSSTEDSIMDKYIKQCTNTVFAAAAGNAVDNNPPVDIAETPLYPASSGLGNVIAIASTDKSDNISTFSNYGKSIVELAAPGTSIYSTYKSTAANYTYLSGTSMATPLVSSALAVMRAAAPSVSPAKCIYYLTAGADKITKLTSYVKGGKRLNAYNSIRLAMPSPSPSPSPSPKPSPSPSPSPSPKPTPMPEATDAKLYSSDGELNISLTFDSQIDSDDINIFAVYKTDGLIKYINKFEFGDDYNASMSVPAELEGETPEIYVWSKSLQPLYQIIPSK